jgi:hypothetical protein
MYVHWKSQTVEVCVQYPPSEGDTYRDTYGNTWCMSNIRRAPIMLFRDQPYPSYLVDLFGQNKFVLTEHDLQPVRISFLGGWLDFTPEGLPRGKGDFHSEVAAYDLHSEVAAYSWVVKPSNAKEVDIFVCKHIPSYTAFGTEPILTTLVEVKESYADFLPVLSKVVEAFREGSSIPVGR